MAGSSVFEVVVPDAIRVRERPVWFGGVRLRARTTVVRLPGGALWVHSPCAPTDDVCAALDALGEVRWIVVPNRCDHLETPATAGRSPKAQVVGPESARSRNPAVNPTTSADDPTYVAATSELTPVRCCPSGRASATSAKRIFSVVEGLMLFDGPPFILSVRPDETQRASRVRVYEGVPMKNVTVQTPINGVVVFGAMVLRVSGLPTVPADRKEVLAAVEGTTWRIAEGNRAEAINGLRQIQARAAAHGAELGDLAPAPETCGALADELEETYRFVERLESLKQYAEARRALLETRADAMLREAHEEVVRRIERGRIPAESYGSVRAYVDAHGVAIAQGRARAERVRAEMKTAAPANDAHTPAKTGTENR